MKLNDNELLQYASSRLGKADKEGCLWMREVEGKIRKRQSKEWLCGVVEELYALSHVQVMCRGGFCSQGICFSTVKRRFQ